MRTTQAGQSALSPHADRPAQNLFADAKFGNTRAADLHEADIVALYSAPVAAASASCFACPEVASKLEAVPTSAPRAASQSSSCSRMKRVHRHSHAFCASQTQ